MFTDKECELLNERLKNTMVGAMGVRFLPSDDEYALAEMPINDSTRQYFGILHGGASLALAETIAGAGSLHLINYDMSKKVCGVQVSGNHIAMSATEGKVFAKGTVIHCGRSSHIWNVDIVGEDGKLLSTERVENRILG